MDIETKLGTGIHERADIHCRIKTNKLNKNENDMDPYPVLQ